jgi:hypothetical protein
MLCDDAVSTAVVIVNKSDNRILQTMKEGRVLGYVFCGLFNCTGYCIFGGCDNMSVIPVI